MLYPKIYTLYGPFDNGTNMLSGRIFRIYQNTLSKRLTFVDAISNDPILVTDEMLDWSIDITGVIKIVTAEYAYYVRSISRILKKPEIDLEEIQVKHGHKYVSKYGEQMFPSPCKDLSL